MRDQALGDIDSEPTISSIEGAHVDRLAGLGAELNIDRHRVLQRTRNVRAKQVDGRWGRQVLRCRVSRSTVVERLLFRRDQLPGRLGGGRKRHWHEAKGNQREFCLGSNDRHGTRPLAIAVSVGTARDFWLARQVPAVFATSQKTLRHSTP